MCNPCQCLLPHIWKITSKRIIFDQNSEADMWYWHNINYLHYDWSSKSSNKRLSTWPFLRRQSYSFIKPCFRWYTVELVDPKQYDLFHHEGSQRNHYSGTGTRVFDIPSSQGEWGLTGRIMNFPISGPGPGADPLGWSKSGNLFLMFQIKWNTIQKKIIFNSWSVLLWGP